MFSAIIILLALPYTDLSRSRGMQFRPLSKITFYIFVANFLILMQLGAKHVESPFIELGQISTIFYFAYFLILMPFVSLFENSLIELTLFKNIKESEDMGFGFVVLKCGFDEVLKNIFGKFVNKKFFTLFIAILSTTAVSFTIRYIFKYFNIDLFAILPHELSALIIAFMAIFSICMPSILDLLSTQYHVSDLINKMPSSKEIISIFNDRSAYGPITFESNKMHMGSMDSMMDSGKTPSPKDVEIKLNVMAKGMNIADILNPTPNSNSTPTPTPTPATGAATGAAATGAAVTPTPTSTTTPTPTLLTLAAAALYDYPTHSDDGRPFPKFVAKEFA
jgi:ubiquinol-cytochrome c reductase cytochrome b subunit